MTIAVHPVDAVSGSPTLTGRKFRHILSAALPAIDGYPYGTIGGVRWGTPSSTVTASSSTWGVATHVGVVDPHYGAQAGPYLYEVTVAESGSMNAAHATNPRYDIISVRIDDPAESDGSSVPAAAVVYTAGTAAASPSVPATPARSMKLAEIYVPASGGGAPTVAWVAHYLASGAGPHFVRDTTERAALATLLGPTTENPLIVWRKDATAGKRLETTSDGTAWYVLDGRDTDWVSISVGGGYNAASTAQCRKIGDQVFIRAQFNRNTGNVTSGDTLGTLPSGSRPTGGLTHRYTVSGSTSTNMKIGIDSSGVISVGSTPSGTTTLVEVFLSFAV